MDFQQNNNSSPCITVAPSLEMVVGGAAGSTEVNNSVSPGTALDSSFGGIPGGGANWNAGNWTVRINITSSNMNVTWVGLRIRRLSAACVAQETLYDNNAAFSEAFSSTGVKTQTVSANGAASPAADDVVMVELYLNNSNTMSAQSYGYTPDQIITSPFTASAGFSIDAQPGSFALTGVAAGLVAGRVVDAQPGSFTITGFAATLSRGFQLDAQPAAFAVTGVEAGLLADRVLDAEPGTFVLTGMLASLVAGYVADAQPGSFVITGNAAGLLADRVLSADPGALILTGSDAGLLADRLIVAEPGVYIVTGFDAGLVYAPVGAFELNAEPGVFVVTGADAGLLVDRVLNAEPGSFEVVGVAAELVFSGGAVPAPIKRLIRRMASRTLILGRRQP